MNEDSQPVPPRPRADYSSPGQAIREARERAGMSLDELGSRTRLTRTTLEHMEADAFDQLLEPVYVRGYYRKCARILELPEEPLVKAYESLYTPPPRQAPARLRLAPSGDLNASPRASSRFIIVGPVLALVVIGVIWLMRKAPTSGALNQSVTLIDPDSPAIVVSDALPPLDESRPADEPAATASIDTVAPEASVQEPVEAPAEPVPAGPVGTTLDLDFAALSWARIEDASGKSLLSGVIAAGEKRSLDGTPPYAVFLGNAPGVTVRYGGIEVDTAPHVKSNNTARFSVPAAGN